MLTIRTAQLDILPGNIRANWALIEKEIALAKEEGADLLVLPEMCGTRMPSCARQSDTMTASEKQPETL